MSTVYFPAAGITFLRDLGANNTRDWFEAHRDAYESEVKAPAGFLAEAIALRLGDRLGTPINHKIFRLHRDVRFSKDKTPYNSHVRFAFWPSGDDAAQPMSGPAFYMSVETERHVCGAGAINFSDATLAAYRNRVSDAVQARATAGLLSGLSQSGLTFDEPELKRPPAGMASIPENAALIRRKSLVAWHETAVPEVPRDITLDECLRGFELALPLYNWISAL